MPTRIDVFTLFPDVIDHYVDASILGRARARGQLDLCTHDVRDAAHDAHRSVDDAPFGGGAGMVLAPFATEQASPVAWVLTVTT